MAAMPKPSSNAMLQEIQKKILGSRAEQLTPVEVHRLFSEPITPEFNLTLYRAFQRKALNPDLTLLQAIPRAQTRPYLIPIALCLRFGADANMYVTMPNVGTVHLLGYLYLTLGGDKLNNVEAADIDILDTIVLMMLTQGSRSSLPMFDPLAGKIRGPGDAPASSMSVVEWLADQGYVNILGRVPGGDPSQIRKVVPGAQSLNILAILMDNLSIGSDTYVERELSLAIRAYSLTVFDAIPISDTRVEMDYIGLNDSVTFLNSATYEKLLKHGQIPSYLLINRIITGMKAYRTAGRIIPFQELQKMLTLSLDSGIELDQDQYNIISGMGSDVLETINRSYQQPYWRKICTVKNSVGDIPESLRQVAIALNIDHTLSKAAICETLIGLSKADKESLKEAARRRQELRMAGDLGTINEFLNGKTPQLVCRNRSTLRYDPMDYNDLDLAYYRDDQGAVWCFSSDSFASLLEAGVNPTNNTALPESFKDQLRQQIEALQKLGIDAGRGSVGIGSSGMPPTFAGMVDRLTAPDVINEKGSEIQLNNFIQWGLANGVGSDTLKNLTKDKMSAGLRAINFSYDLTPLSTSSALVTTARIINYLKVHDPESLPVFFMAVNSLAWAVRSSVEDISK